MKDSMQIQLLSVWRQCGLLSSSPRWTGSVLIVLSALCAGCNDRPTAQVSGNVLFKGGAVPQGGVRIIRFEPASDTTATIRKSAIGYIADDGSFEMYTRKPGDGVILGKYDVTFTFWKGARDKVSLIDEKYTTAATTPYHITVDDDVNDLKFEIEPAQGGAARPASRAQPAEEAEPAGG
jgi:hypothetical protein